MKLRAHPHSARRQELRDRSLFITAGGGGFEAKQGEI